MKWISVDERPLCEPCDDEGGLDILVDEDILMFIRLRDWSFQAIGGIGDDGWLKTQDGDDIGYLWDDVSHWMPLPDPPEQEG